MHPNWGPNRNPDMCPDQKAAGEGRSKMIWLPWLLQSPPPSTKSWKKATGYTSCGQECALYWKGGETSCLQACYGGTQ